MSVNSVNKYVWYYLCFLLGTSLFCTCRGSYFIILHYSCCKHDKVHCFLKLFVFLLFHVLCIVYVVTYFCFIHFVRLFFHRCTFPTITTTVTIVNLMFHMYTCTFYTCVCIYRRLYPADMFSIVKDSNSPGLINSMTSFPLVPPSIPA